MSRDEDLKPEEFAEAAEAAVTEALELDFNSAAEILGSTGLFGVCASEDDGGLELPIDFAVPICQVAGSMRLRFPLVEQLLVANALAGTPEAAKLIAGTQTATIAWKVMGKPYLAAHTAYAEHCTWILVPENEGALLVEKSSVQLQANDALDPEAPQYSVNFEGAKIIAEISPKRFAELREHALILTGAYLNGLAEGAIQYTTDYLATRVQFGRPLTAKQAVRHHLARMKLLSEVSTSAIQRVLQTNEFSETRNTHATWAGAVSNALFIIEKAIHLNGGMGFTWEVPLHYALRDARRIDAALDGSAMTQSVGQAFISAA